MATARGNNHFVEFIVAGLIPHCREEDEYMDDGPFDKDDETE
jgi:hypothetical protein